MTPQQNLRPIRSGPSTGAVIRFLGWACIIGGLVGYVAGRLL